MPLLPFRSEPSERYEMISQLVFGELFEVLAEQDSWCRIRNLSDHYTGWCSKKMLQLLPQNTFETLRNAKPVFTRAILSPCYKRGEDIPQLYLPAGSRLYFLDKETGSFPIFNSKPAGTNEPESDFWLIDPNALQVSATISEATLHQKIVETAKLFMNAPYLWGGKSILGIDCSGLTQLVFSMFGFDLPRDARDQALVGIPVLNLSEAGSGDLAFFTNSDGKVVHVGILLDHGHILHASGCVHIDCIDSEGIYSEAQTCYTHQLYSIKRLHLSQKG